MSATTPGTPAPPPPPATTRAHQPTLDVSGTAPIPFSRLVGVEFRKMHDTRAGFWLLLITGILLVLVGGLTILIVGLNDLTTSAEGLMTQVFTVPLSLLLPVFAVLIVTSEWGQRTALASFTLEPRRLRVMWAKLVAVSLLALAAIALAFAVGLVTNLVCAAITGNDVVWDLDGSKMFWTFAQQLLFFLLAFGFASLLLNTPGAISFYYVYALVLPFLVWGTLYALVDWAPDVVPWIDLGSALSPFSTDANLIGEPEKIEAVNYFQLLVTVLVWVVLPLGLGARRVQRAEVK